jgi:mannose-6-phosphate isomerase-like protein (cupin superfamily)
MTKALVNVPGKEVTMITVDYPPGAVDPVHRHYASAFVYVLEGSIVMQMKGGKQVTLHPGQTFYEDPKGIHLVGPERQRHQAGKIPGAPRQGEGRAHSRVSDRVTFNVQRSTFNVQRSTFGVRRSAFGVRRSTAPNGER